MCVLLAPRVHLYKVVLVVITSRDLTTALLLRHFVS